MSSECGGGGGGAESGGGGGGSAEMSSSSSGASEYGSSSSTSETGGDDGESVVAESDAQANSSAVESEALPTEGRREPQSLSEAVGEAAHQARADAGNVLSEHPPSEAERLRGVDCKPSSFADALREAARDVRHDGANMAGHSDNDRLREAAHEPKSAEGAYNEGRSEVPTGDAADADAEAEGAATAIDAGRRRESSDVEHQERAADEALDARGAESEANDAAESARREVGGEDERRGANEGAKPVEASKPGQTAEGDAAKPEKGKRIVEQTDRLDDVSQDDISLSPVDDRGFQDEARVRTYDHLNRPLIAEQWARPGEGEPVSKGLRESTNGVVPGDLVNTAHNLPEYGGGEAQGNTAVAPAEANNRMSVFDKAVSNRLEAGDQLYLRSIFHYDKSDHAGPSAMKVQVWEKGSEGQPVMTDRCKVSIWSDDRERSH